MLAFERFATKIDIVSCGCIPSPFRTFPQPTFWTTQTNRSPCAPPAVYEAHPTAVIWYNAENKETVGSSFYSSIHAWSLSGCQTNPKSIRPNQGQPNWSQPNWGQPSQSQPNRDQAGQSQPSQARPNQI
jgi:hypothetical protein